MRIIVGVLMLLSLWLLSSVATIAADPTSAGPGANDYMTDLAIPDAPAFQLVDTTASTILRPSSLRDFAVSLSNVWESDQPVALEIAPVKLFSGRKLSLADYQNHPSLYRLRLSIATRGPLSQPDAIAFGIRHTPKDDADLLADREKTALAIEVSKRIGRIIDSVGELARTPAQLIAGDTIPVDSIRALPGVRMLTDPIEEQFREQVVRDWEENSWNANATTFAFAFLLENADTLTQSLRFSQFALWGTKAMAWESWGQLLIGVTAKAVRESMESDNYNFDGSVSTRLYAGRNDAKLLMESQLSTAEGQKLTFFFAGGGEARVQNDLWVEFNLGARLVGGEDKAHAESQVKLKLAM